MCKGYSRQKRFFKKGFNFGTCSGLLNKIENIKPLSKKNTLVLKRGVFIIGSKIVPFA
jgi:hypothetical protein